MSQVPAPDLKATLDMIENSQFVGLDQIARSVFADPASFANVLALLKEKQYIFEKPTAKIKRFLKSAPTQDLLTYIDVYPRVYAWLEGARREEMALCTKAVQCATCFEAFEIYHALPPKRRHEPHLLEPLLACNGNLLRALSTQERSDERLVGIAIKCDPQALRYASRTLRESNKNINQLALEGNAMCLRWCGMCMKNNVQVVSALLERDPKVYRYASVAVRSDPNVIEKALLGHAGNYLSIPGRHKAKRHVCQSALQGAGALLRVMPEAIQNDVKMVYLAVLSQRWAINAAGPLVREQIEHVQKREKIGDKVAALKYLILQKASQEEHQALEQSVKKTVKRGSWKKSL